MRDAVEITTELNKGKKVHEVEIALQITVMKPRHVCKVTARSVRIYNEVKKSTYSGFEKGGKLRQEVFEYEPPII